MSSLNTGLFPARRQLLLGLLLGLMSLVTQQLSAQERAAVDPAPSPQATDQCVASFDNAQKQRLAGQLLAARKELVRCAQPVCPAVVSAKCVEWLEQIKVAIPSIVVAARDARGADLIDAQLFIDGALVSERIDGAAIDLDVGKHTLFVRQAGRQRSMVVLVREGEQRRRIDVTLADRSPSLKPRSSPQPPSTPSSPKPAVKVIAKPEPLTVPITSWVGFSAGAAGLLVGTATGIAAVVIADDLQNRCEQGICHPAEQESLEAGTALAHASTVSFIVAAAGTAAGVVAFVIAEDDLVKTGGPAQARLTLRLAPARVSLEGRF